MALTMAFTGCASSPSSSAAPETKAPETSAPETTAPESEAPSGEKEVVKIGVLLPFSGSSSYYAEHQNYGIKYALADFLENPAYDTSNIEIQLVEADSTGTADTAVTEFERLVNEENVNAVIGPYNSGAGAAIAPLAIMYKVPLMVVNAVSDVIMEEDNEYVYRTNLGDKDGNDSNIEFFTYLMGMSEKPVKKVAYVYENSDYGSGMTANHTTNVTKPLGCEVVLEEPFTSGSGDLSSVVNKVKNSGADIVCVCAFTDDAVLFTRQMAEYEVDVPILAFGAGFSTEEYITQCGELSNYILNSGSWIYSPSAMTEDANAICDAYMKESGVTLPNETFANGWLGMYSLLDAITRADSTSREDIAKALAATDIPADSRALLFHTTFGGIRYEDHDGRYNQNVFAGMMEAQLMDGQWNILKVNDEAGDLSGMVWPIPNWTDR